MNCLNESTKNRTELNELNYYQILGCDPNSSMEQISTEYKIRALACHPDKNNNNLESNKEFQLLLEAKEILTNESMRSKYDFWLNSGINISWKEWLKLTTSNNPVFHWVVKKQEPMITDSTTHSESINSNDSNIRNYNTITFNRDLKQFRSCTNQISDNLSKFRNHQI